MSDKPEALRLADRLDLWGDQGDLLEAAALLRRQHAQIECLYAQQTDYEDAIASSKAERDALRVELQSVLDDWNALVKASGSPTNGGAIGHVRALQAECDALRADAERYRWLRSDVATAENYPIACMRDGGWLLLGDELDAAIDAAREGK